MVRPSGNTRSRGNNADDWWQVLKFASCVMDLQVGVASDCPAANKVSNQDGLEDCLVDVARLSPSWLGKDMRLISKHICVTSIQTLAPPFSKGLLGMDGHTMLLAGLVCQPRELLWGSYASGMGVFPHGLSSALTCHMKVWHLGRKDFVPGEAGCD